MLSGNTDRKCSFTEPLSFLLDLGTPADVTYRVVRTEKLREGRRCTIENLELILFKKNFLKSVENEPKHKALICDENCYTIKV